MGYTGKKPTNVVDVSETQSLTVNDNLTTPSINSGQIGGRRNVVINGEMKIAQRGDQTSQTGVAMAACDRWIVAEAGDTVVDTSQSTDVPSGQGFANSLKVDVTTADASLAADDFFLIIQRIEGQDVQHFRYGTSSARDVTVSFWVKSAKTGTHILEIRQNTSTVFNSQAYTIASANTWQKVELTFSGYTVAAIADDNAHGFSLNWFLAAGSTFSGGTLNSNTWHNTAANRAVGQVNVVDSDANNFYLTGVMVEVGGVATEFEHRSFSEELALCQRYYQSTNTVGRNQAFGFGTRQTTNTVRFSIPTPVTLRADPSVSISGTVNCLESDGSTTSTTSISGLYTSAGYVVATGTASGVVAGSITMQGHSGTIQIEAEL